MLPPSVREAAKSRLLENRTHWEITNVKAGEFWGTYYDSKAGIKSYYDAIRVIESFEHYYSIEDWHKAVMAWRKSSRSRKFGCSSILQNQRKRLGENSLLLPLEQLEQLDISIADAINLFYVSKYSDAIKILYLDPKVYKGRNSITKDWIKTRVEWLCACYTDIGEFKLAIEYGNYVIGLGTSIHTRQIHLLNLVGSSHCSLCDFDVSINSHQAALDIAKKECSQEHIAYSHVYLAYCQISKMEFFKSFSKEKVAEVTSILQESINVFKQIDDKSSEVIANCHLVKLYLYLHIEKNTVARRFYDNAYSINQKLSQETSFSSPYLKNLLLTILAKLNFMDRKFDETINLLKQSIFLCEEMGTKFFLAESYFQLGLTYQAMGEHDQAETYKAKALELFGQMEAPKQIERVNQAFEQGAKQ